MEEKVEYSSTIGDDYIEYKVTKSCSQFEFFIPKHEFDLYIVHNNHKRCGLDVKEEILSRDDLWESEEAKQRAVETNEMWTMIWGVVNSVNRKIEDKSIAAPTLNELLFFYYKNKDKIRNA